MLYNIPNANVLLFTVDGSTNDMRFYTVSGGLSGTGRGVDEIYWSNHNCTNAVNDWHKFRGTCSFLR